MPNHGPVPLPLPQLVTILALAVLFFLVTRRRPK